jgi:hypothetical protein
VLVLVAVGGFLNADSIARDAGYHDVDYSNPYSNVQDVFVYDDQGHLVTGARLFDQDGQPIHLGNPYCYDENGTQTGPDNDSVYPYCPERAPFRMPGPVDASVSPSAVPSGAVPDPDPSGSTPFPSTPFPSTPSGSGRPTASPSGPAPPATGAPTRPGPSLSTGR